MNLDKVVIRASHSQQPVSVHRQAVNRGSVASDGLEMLHGTSETSHSCLLKLLTTVGCHPSQDLVDERSASLMTRSGLIGG